MDEFKSIDDILDFAIAGETEANQFYTELAAKMTAPAMKKAFEDFAAEERGHKARLESIKKGGAAPAFEKVTDLGMAKYLVDIEPKPEMSYEQAIILAMKKEKAAFRLYTDLAAKATDPDIRALFLSLAQEEAKHKLRFEIEYDDNVLREN